MAARIAPARSASQGRVDTTALQAVERLSGIVEGHIQRDDDRFENSRDDVRELKEEIKQLSTDAKQAIDGLDKKYDGNHRDNQSWMQRLETKIDSVATRITVLDGKREGAVWLGMTIRDWLILLFAAAAIVVPIIRHP